MPIPEKIVIPEFDYEYELDPRKKDPPLIKAWYVVLFLLITIPTVGFILI